MELHASGIVFIACLGACSATTPPNTSTPLVEVSPSTGGGEGAEPTNAGPPPGAREQPSEASIEVCTAMRREGIRLHDAARYEEAIATYRRGLQVCGPGAHFAGELGYTLAATGDFDAAADQYLAEIGAPAPGAVTFGNLVQALPKLSMAKRAAVAEAGSTADQAIFVDEIGTEYYWVERVACGGAGGTVDGQALIRSDGRQLDKLSYRCPDGSKHETYFDFSADPREQAMRRELQTAP